jgi:hypothetical protein
VLSATFCALRCHDERHRQIGYFEYVRCKSLEVQSQPRYPASQPGSGLIFFPENRNPRGKGCPRRDPDVGQSAARISYYTIAKKDLDSIPSRDTLRSHLAVARCTRPTLVGGFAASRARACDESCCTSRSSPPSLPDKRRLLACSPSSRLRSRVETPISLSNRLQQSATHSKNLSCLIAVA